MADGSTARPQPDALSRASLRTQAAADLARGRGPLRRVQQDVRHLRRAEECGGLHVHADGAEPGQGHHRRPGGPGDAHGGACRCVEAGDVRASVLRARAARADAHRPGVARVRSVAPLPAARPASARRRTPRRRAPTPSTARSRPSVPHNGPDATVAADDAGTRASRVVRRHHGGQWAACSSTTSTTSRPGETTPPVRTGPPVRAWKRPRYLVRQPLEAPSERSPARSPAS